MNILEERNIDPVRAWIAVVVTFVSSVAVAAIAFPGLVYERFLWRYFWGPVVADAHPGECAVRSGDGVELTSGTACATAESAGQVVAYPGYTVISTAGYVGVLLLAVVGIYLALQRFNLGTSAEFFYALIPFVFFGGALRTVEDVSLAAVHAGSGPLVEFPLSALLISPFIYGTVFALTAVCLAVGVVLEQWEIVDSYHRVAFGLGVALLAMTVLFLTYVGLTAEYAAVYPQIPAIVLTAATLGAVGTWVVAERFAPEINTGTGLMGAVIIWGHAVDGAANVIGLDYMELLEAGQNLAPKHPLNSFVVDFFGAAWPFFVLKIAVATFVVWLFDDEIFEETPRFAIVLLVTVLAVGLGPGTRDLLRITFGV